MYDHRIDTEELPEYLHIFGREGPYRVEVRFKSHDGSVAVTRISAKEISKLINKDTGLFHEVLTFDDWPAQILKYEIQPRQKRIIITTEMLITTNLDTGKQALD